MALVQYPESDSDGDDQTHIVEAQQVASPPKSALKRKHSEATQDDLPPLPTAFHDLYTTNARISTSDNPSLHGGRKRAIPHVEGNWPSHVYLEWIPSNPESSTLHELIQHVRDTLEAQNKKRAKKLSVPSIIPSLQSELGVPVPLHISLSRTLQIPTEDREDFVNTLRSCLRKAAVGSFRFKFSSLKWVPNYERNRWFLVLSIEKPAQNELNALLNACNNAAEKCGRPGLYVGGRGDGPMDDDAGHEGSKRRKSEQSEGEHNDYSDRFHITIAWNLEEPDPEWTSLIKTIDVSKYIQSPQASFDAVKVRVGNVVHNIALERGTKGSIIGLK